MELDKILEGHEKKQEILDYVEKIKNDSAIEGSRKANNEAKNLRERLNKSKSILSRFEIDPDSEGAEETAEQVYSRIKPKDSSKDPEIMALKKQIGEFEKKYKDAEEKALTFKKNNYINSVKQSLNKSLLDEGAVSTDLAEVLFSRLALDYEADPSEVKFAGENGKDLVTGVKEYINSQPWAKKNPAHPGGGTNTSFAQAANPQQKLSALQKINLGLKKE